MNADQPTILVPAEYGAPFEGGFYGGQIPARLRRLFAHFNFPLPKFADDDERLIGIAGSVIGAVLTNLECGSYECKVPSGWRFYAADASIIGKCSVMLTRDEAGTKAWHALSESEKEAESLFASGVGHDFNSALRSAIAGVNACAKEQPDAG